ncbi:hypothetical protein GOODEAATRI_000418 [Goodea atripinnis]|uniref:Doublecortin domain-containing protein n=1 Tax=Goodea atripinnis TaxID=208336 RepID=A0ABV0NGA8_9TELE
MNETRLRRTVPDQSSGSGYTIDTSHHSVTNTILSKRVCFYKSGDPQFNGLRVVINNRTFKTFDALLDSLSKKVPLPFGVRNITTPRGVHGINTLDELEDGKSYICSDNRKVKPIDLALARRKLPPWYHVRPASSRRRTAKFFPGWKNIHREDPVVFRTPKKLVVFRNGNPSVRYTVLLHKKTTPSYESILGHISELMQFHVSKLHTPNGQRIDGLPGLILCSGSVVAVGREPFRPVEYSAEKPPSPTRRHTKERAFKRENTSIHNSIAESSCDLPSNITNSIESDPDRILESLTETEEDTCLGKGGDEGQDGALSNDDNIEKSFRVNQDGSMTVEMKVRLTIKEEETIQWTTTLTRSVVADQLNVPCLLDSDPDQEVCLKNSQTSAASTDIIHKDRTRDENDDDPPLLGNGAFIDSCQEVDDLKDHTEGAPPRRAPTPGCKTRSKLQSSVDSFEDVTVDKYEEGKVGSYFFGEETENRTTEQFYLDQKGTRPVPKPRQLGSVDANSRDFSAFKSTEIMQTESSREEVTETVLHIYEQQTCHDNFLANVGVHSVPASGATSETRQLCSSNEFDLWRPSLAFEPVSKWRTDSRSVTSDLHLASLKAGAKREQLQQSTKSYVKPGEKEVKKDQCVSSRPRKHVRLVMTAVQLEDSNLEKIERQSDVITQSVAERVTLLEQQVAEAQRPKLAPKSSPIRRFSQRKSPPELVDSPSELLLCTRSAPQSSLSFSYDSSGVITTEPEGSSVRSIREMFLARSATDIQQRGLSSSNSSELRAETSGSGGYQSQTSSDLSSSEDVLAQKSISKGLVKRAIEMLYGKKDLKPEEASKRSPSEPNQRKREPTSIFSPFHAAGSKAMSELSYFNSSNALDIFSEATRCVAFNAQVGPGDSVPIDNGRWLLREKTSMRKSVSDPIGINKTFTNTFHDDGLCKDTEEKTPYSLFSTKPEVEDETKSQPGKCTYFSLPYASESEVCQDEMGAVSMSSKNEDDVLDSAEETKDSSEDSKTWAERNSILPGIGAADFKMKGNKVHPLVELPPDGEVVVVQPGKGLTWSTWGRSLSYSEPGV